MGDNRILDLKRVLVQDLGNKEDTILTINNKLLLSVNDNIVIRFYVLDKAIEYVIMSKSNGNTIDTDTIEMQSLDNMHIGHDGNGLVWIRERNGEKDVITDVGHLGIDFQTHFPNTLEKLNDVIEFYRKNY